MSANRAAVILIQDGAIALLERHRDGKHYYVFPGGHFEPGETPEQAAAREAFEELGVQVVVRRLVAQGEVNGRWNQYFLAEITGGTFGSGAGEEWTADRPKKGSYAAVWLPVGDLPAYPVKPEAMAEHVFHHALAGWSDTVLTVTG